MHKKVAYKTPYFSKMKRKNFAYLIFSPNDNFLNKRNTNIKIMMP